MEDYVSEKVFESYKNNTNGRRNDALVQYVLKYGYENSVSMLLKSAQNTSDKVMKDYFSEAHKNIRKDAAFMRRIEDLHRSK